MLKILIADNDSVFWEKLSDIEWRQVWLECPVRCEEADIAYQQADVLNPAVVIVNAETTDSQGQRCAERLRMMLPEAELILLADREAFSSAMNAIKLGAAGLMLRTSSRSELEEILSEASRKYRVRHLPGQVMWLVWMDRPETILTDILTDDSLGHCVHETCSGLIGMVENETSCDVDEQLAFYLEKVNSWGLYKHEKYWVHVLFTVISVALIRNHGGTVPAAVEDQRKMCSAVFYAMKEGHIFELLSGLYHTAVAAAGNRQNSRAMQSVKMARDIIRQCYADPKFNISTLSKVMYMHEGYLRRIFKAQCGKTPHAVLKEVRMNEARQLLAQGDMQVQQVAQRVGFEDTSYFSKCFKQFFGYPPCRISSENDSARGKKEHSCNSEITPIE